MQVWAALTQGGNLWLFVPLMSANLCLLGFTGANFSSIAMQPFEHTAGSASSAQAFVRMILGAGPGIAIGQAYDGSAKPLAFALLRMQPDQLRAGAVQRAGAAVHPAGHDQSRLDAAVSLRVTLRCQACATPARQIRTAAGAYRAGR